MVVVTIICILAIIQCSFSYTYEKIKLRKGIRNNIPDNAIDFEKGILNLQNNFPISQNVKKESWKNNFQTDLNKIDFENNALTKINTNVEKPGYERILYIICVILLFFPFLIAMVLRYYYPSLQSSFLLFGYMFFVMVCSFGSGIQAGMAHVIIETENKTGRMIVIEKLK